MFICKPLQFFFEEAKMNHITTTKRLSSTRYAKEEIPEYQQESK